MRVFVRPVFTPQLYLTLTVLILVVGKRSIRLFAYFLSQVRGVHVLDYLFA